MRINKSTYVLLLIVVMFSINEVYAQTIKGTVTDKLGGIGGASVLVKGTTNGTYTDVDGRYSIGVRAEDTVLEFSFIGYATQEANIGGRTEINIVLEENSSQLNEVIVTGYGTVTKKDATGAVDAINSDNFDLVAAASPAQLLRGKVAGVQVTGSSGEPGAGVAIRIRGNTSMRSGNGPLIVVDGVPLDGGNISSGTGNAGGTDGESANVLGTGVARNPLNFINQNDIQSINVLKDASSTAIYGSRGANGVIVITTKGGKGRKGTSISYSPSFSIGQFQTGSSFNDVQSKSEYLKNGGNDEGGEYDWKKTLLRTSLSHGHDISMSTSGDNGSNRISLGFSDTQGIIKNTGLKKYTIALNNNTHFFDKKLNIGTKLMYSKILDQSHLLTTNAGHEGNLIQHATTWNPSLNTRGGNGSDTHKGFTFISGTKINPAHILEAYKDNADTNKVIGNISASYNFLDKFTYKLLLGVDVSSSVRTIEIDPSMDIEGAARTTVSEIYRGQVSKYNDERLNIVLEHTLNYKTKLDNGIDINGLVGYSYYNYNSKGYQLHAEGFNAAQVNLANNIIGAAATGFTGLSYASQYEIQSYFARLVGGYKKILATFTYRLDGSSKLGEKNKYGGFPSVGLGYKLFEEKTGIINDLKARGNWGIVGNQEFAANVAIAKINYNNLSERTVTNPNPDLTWETTTNYGVGVDFKLLDHKLSGSLDYFIKNTTDLIFPQPPAATQPGPAQSKYINLNGTLVNSGFEVSLNYILLSKADMTWNISGNAAFLSNEIQDFTAEIQAGALNGRGLTNAYAQVLKNGKPLYSYFLAEFVGYDANGNSQYIEPDGTTGPLGTAAKNVLDKQALPKMNVGFSTNFTYKSFDVSTSFYGAFGHYIYNNTANALYSRASFPNLNVPKTIIETGQNISDSNSPSTKYLESGDFLRWSSLSFGYHLPQTFLDSIKISSAKVYLNISNLMVFTNYTGFDPEVDTDKSLNGVPSAGMDYLSYPRNRTFSMGLNVTF